MLLRVAVTCETWTAMMLLKRCVHESGAAARPGRSGAAARLARGPSRVLLAALAAVGLSSCAETPRTATNFCRVLADRLAEITEPPTDNAAVDRLIEHYSRLAEVAPLEVEDDIVALRDLFIAASQVDVNDPESVQTVADLAYGADQAAEDAGIYAGATCGIDLSNGFVVQVPGVPTLPVTPDTTLAP